jgi:ribosomal protein S3
MTAIEKIAEFYYKKHSSVDQAIHEVLSLRITNITEDDTEVRITLSRPGILIGRNGTNITDLINHMGKSIRIIEAENCVTDQIIIEIYNQDPSYLNDY